MASRGFFTIEEVLQEIDKCGSDDNVCGSDDDVYESGSEDGCVDEEEYSREREEEGEGEEGEEEGEGEEGEEEGEGEEGEERMEIDADGEGGSSEQHACSQVPAIPSYTLQAGCTATIEGNRPLSYFSKLVDTPLLQHVVEQTNLYASNVLQTLPSNSTQG